MASLGAIVPVFIIILCGYLYRRCCRHYDLHSDDFWLGAEKVTYFIFFPCLLVSTIAQADLSDINFGKPLIVLFVLYLSISILLFISKPLSKFNNKEFTSVYQGSIRFNTYIGLAIVSSLYGEEGLVIAAILVAMMIPLINIACVFVLELFSDNSSEKMLKRIIRSMLFNPLILACIIGMAINFSGLAMSPSSLPAIFFRTLDIFASAALPLGLLTVGAALVFTSIKISFRALVTSSIFKFLLLPGAAMLLCALLSIEPAVREVMLVFMLLPTASASYVLARQLGGDYQLMATIITVQTLLAVALIPSMLIAFAAAF